tara:strand:+ start:2773 stop:3066 length:294 start_codon:yes stop_codon:yes gene_type:complete
MNHKNLPEAVSTFFKENPSIEKLNIMNKDKLINTYVNPEHLYVLGIGPLANDKIVLPPRNNPGTLRVIATAYSVDSLTASYFDENPNIFGYDLDIDR